MKIRKRIFTLILGVMMAVSLYQPREMRAAEVQGRVIRIGYIDYDGFIWQQEDGSYVGYGVEYLDKIADFTGWEYEYVYDSWDQHMESLKNGEIDFLCHAQITEERQQDYLFSRYSVGDESNVLYVKPEDERYYYNDYTQFDGMTIAMMEGSYQNAEFAQYAQDKGFTYTEVDFMTQAECFEALDRGEVDGVAMGSLALKSNYKMVCRMGSDPFYFMTGQGNAEILSQLNDALSQIYAADPYFKVDIYQKYYSESSYLEPLFSREEMEYIQSSGEISIALIPNRRPFSYLEDGEPAGITVDLLNLIAEKSGLTFQYSFMPAGTTAFEYMAEYPERPVAGIMTDNPGFQGDDYVLSGSFYADNVTLACKSGMAYDLGAEDASYVLAIPRSYIALKSYIEINYPQFSIVTGSTTEECIRQVLSGKADFMAQNVNVITPLLADPHYDGMMMLPTYFMEERTGIVALNSDEHRMLMDIIDKCIVCISEKEESQITVNHTIKNAYQMSFSDMLYKFRIPLIFICVLLAVCMSLMGGYMYQKKRSNTRLSEKNAQLADAVAQADSANRAKSTFLARMSHEIRTPMNAIVGLTTIAKHHELEPEKIDEYLTKIDTSSKVLLNIINDVLDMSAIESEKLKIAYKPFNLREVLTSIATMYYPQCRQKGVHFEMVTADIEHESLVGDGLRINQILLNLVSNAYKFTPKDGKITIVVKEVEQRDGKAFFQFSVEDTGEGMTQEMQERLFKPFEQEAADTAVQHGGSGLGLSIAKNLVELMKGSISCASEKNKGTIFTVMLPFAIDRDAMDLAQERIKSVRALVVDDEAVNCEYTTVILDRIGVPYDVAKGGAEAIEKLKQAKAIGSGYDICFVDWVMPGLNGGAVTHEIRKLYEKDTLVIVVSAYDTTEIEKEAADAGADMFISKPLFQSTVFNLLMKLSGGRFVNQTADADSYDFHGERALLAEDTEFNAEIAEELLEMVNMKIDHAINGKEAVRMFEESAPGTYKLILMDIQMPEMDGYEAAKMIRAGTHPQAKNIPIFAMTANAFTEDVSEALNAGMNGHIAKPIDTNILYGTINKVLNG